MSTATLNLIAALLDVIFTSRWNATWSVHARTSGRRVRRIHRIRGNEFRVDYF